MQLLVSVRTGLSEAEQRTGNGDRGTLTAVGKGALRRDCAAGPNFGGEHLCQGWKELNDLPSSMAGNRPAQKIADRIWAQMKNRQLSLTPHD